MPSMLYLRNGDELVWCLILLVHAQARCETDAGDVQESNQASEKKGSEEVEARNRVKRTKRRKEPDRKSDCTAWFFNGWYGNRGFSAVLCAFFVSVELLLLLLLSVRETFGSTEVLVSSAC